MKIHGINDVARALDKLPDELKRGGEARVLRAGAKPIVKAARGKVPSQSSTLKKSLGTRVKKLRGQRTARIGARTNMGRWVTINGVREYRNPVKYSKLVEYGTAHSAPNPFIRPAVETSKGEVVAAMAVGLEKHLTSAVRKVRARRTR